MCQDHRNLCQNKITSLLQQQEQGRLIIIIGTQNAQHHDQDPTLLKRNANGSPMTFQL